MDVQFIIIIHKKLMLIMLPEYAFFLVPSTGEFLSYYFLLGKEIPIGSVAFLQIFKMIQPLVREAKKQSSLCVYIWLLFSLSKI